VSAGVGLGPKLSVELRRAVAGAGGSWSWPWKSWPFHAGLPAAQSPEHTLVSSNVHQADGDQNIHLTAPVVWCPPPSGPPLVGEAPTTANHQRICSGRTPRLTRHRGQVTWGWHPGAHRVPEHVRRIENRRCCSAARPHPGPQKKEHALHRRHDHQGQQPAATTR